MEKYSLFILSQAPSVISLEIARAFRNHNIYIFYLHFPNPASYSRYIKKSFKLSEENSWLNTIIKVAKTIEDKEIVIIPQNDTFLEFLNNNRKQLEDRAIIPAIPPDETVKLFFNKKETYKFVEKLGIKVPLYSVFDGKTPHEYPCIIKPSSNTNFKKTFGCKILIFQNEKQYNLLAPRLKNYKEELLLTQYIWGEPAQVWSFSGFCKNGELISYWTGQHKLLEYPENGTGVLARSFPNKEVKEMGSCLLQAVKFTGIFEIEFKHDKNLGKYYFLEVNTRPIAQIKLARILKLDFLKLYVESLLGIGDTSQCCYTNARIYYWVNEAALPFYFFKLLTKHYKMYLVSLRYYFLILVAKFHWFELNDPFPSFYILRSFITDRIMGKIAKTFARKGVK